MNRTIAWSAGGALLICALIGAVFPTLSASFAVTMLIALSYCTAMPALSAALSSFLGEAYPATANPRIGLP